MARPTKVLTAWETDTMQPRDDAGSRCDEEAQLGNTRVAFDSVASSYDGPLGNNVLIQHMRREMWRTLVSTVPAGARLLDIGCGTGIDAEHLAGLGYEIVAIDWSPEMTSRTRSRADAAGLSSHVKVIPMGVHELDRLSGELFDGIYSNLGPLNCAPDLSRVARMSSALLKKGGLCVVSVIGRVCPWELFYYSVRGRWTRAKVRFAHEAVPVNLNNNTVWTRYYTPREFYRAFSREFRLLRYRSLQLFLPPPYLIGFYERWPRLCGLLGQLDDHLCSLPLLRNAGDHFLMVLAKRD
jgi:ubiquinone/menaquinone biosynthesis C-methylase UbiE